MGAEVYQEEAYSKNRRWCSESRDSAPHHVLNLAQEYWLHAVHAVGNVAL